MKKLFVALMSAVLFIMSAQAQTIKVSFRNSDDTKSKWPFAEAKVTKAQNVTSATFTLKNTKYKFGFESTYPMYLNSKEGFFLGKEAGNYVKLPAVKGKTLVKVSVKYGGGGSMGKLSVTDAKGNVYEGGKPAKSKEMNYVHTWEVSGVKKGKPAFLTFNHDSILKLKELVLEYE